MKKTHITIGPIVITSPLTCLFWIGVSILFFYCFAGTVMWGPR